MTSPAQRSMISGRWNIKQLISVYVGPIRKLIQASGVTIYEVRLQPRLVEYTARRGKKERLLYANLCAVLGPEHDPNPLPSLLRPRENVFDPPEE